MPETNFVDFLDLDTSKITFQKPKQNKHNGSQIGIRYNGETLYVKYEGVTPFGIQENYDKEGNFYGVSMQINVSEEYAQKAQELDEFFMKAFLQNKWGLNKNIKAEVIRGYDKHGEGGLWKRILKKPYCMNENEREYLDYPLKWNLLSITKVISYRLKFSIGIQNRYLQKNIQKSLLNQK